MNKNFLVALEIDEFRKLVQEIIDESLVKLLPKEKEEVNLDSITDLIPRLDVAKLFGVSLVTLDKWKMKGLIPRPIKQCSRVFYFKDDILKLLKDKKHLNFR